MNTIDNTVKKEDVKMEIPLMQLAEISGGTFTPNTYSKTGYHTYGISTSYHFFDRDEFYFMGHKISYATANKIMEIGNAVYSALNPKGTKPSDCIKPSEPAFIRAFNSQLKLYFSTGYLWNGKQGHDC